MSALWTLTAVIPLLGSSLVPVRTLKGLASSRTSTSRSSSTTTSSEYSEPPRPPLQPVHTYGTYWKTLEASNLAEEKESVICKPLVSHMSSGWRVLQTQALPLMIPRGGSVGTRVTTWRSTHKYPYLFFLHYFTLCDKEFFGTNKDLSPIPDSVRDRNLLWTWGWSHHLARHVLGCLSKQIKGIRALKDEEGEMLCFYVVSPTPPPRLQ